ncbi:Thioredoxin (mitochondrial), Trx M [Schistosoma mansoni]|uniref:Thioredoxin (mitochondrial), Trx M n=1 Tax=Schistosoma mansoni TaxID=6183 RepID=UPI0001A63623|nr:Thioredoxin (mitochondrial), Trx M [Schistosoma mansoni]|eukprot:XP_018649724.1 Thioredoxin (mitochondrial), Trx M [Schistosoma mansoni]
MCHRNETSIDKIPGICWVINIRVILCERCGPCKILGPRLENIMKSYMNSVLLAKVDIDQLDSVAEKYKIKVVPTVISIKNGKEIERFEGNKEEEFIRRRIENVLAHNG